MTTGEDFEDAFRSLYLAYHRRDEPRSELPAASRAVLTHLALTGPVPVGELASHLSRAQSVVSDIVAHLDSDGYVARVPDPADRRRSLVWLTPQGRGYLDRVNRVLDTDRLDAVLHDNPEAPALVASLRALARRAHELPPRRARGSQSVAPSDDVPPHPEPYDPPKEGSSS